MGPGILHLKQGPCDPVTAKDHTLSSEGATHHESGIHSTIPDVLILHSSPLLSGDDELSSFLSFFHNFTWDHKWGLLCNFSYSFSLSALLSSLLGVNWITALQSLLNPEGPYPLLSSSCPLQSPYFVIQHWLMLTFSHIAFS